MIRFRTWALPLAGVLAAGALVVGVVARGDDPPPGSQPAAAPAKNAGRADRTKEVRIERSARRVVAAGSAPATAGAFTNPKVAPGRVRWHPTFAAACEAARRSGKPVLLFQMMGNLDDRFC